MNSISIVRGNGSYYTDLAREDYYTKGGEPKGKWLGGAASHFELAGKKVGNKQFRNVLDGYDPRLKVIEEKTQGLVQNAGKKNRQSGYDFTFSAPKDVSILWAAGGEEIRKGIQKAQIEAVKAAMNYIESNAAYSRRGAQGKDTEPVKLLFAAFEHGTSRLQDPQLHTHVIIPNFGLREDGSTGTLHSDVIRNEDGKVIETYNPLMRHGKAAGALYRAELAYQLESRLGVALEKSEDGFSFDIAGMPKEASEHYSKRRAEIEAHLAEKGFNSAKAAEFANKATRITKEEISRPKLFAKWQDELLAFGVDQEYVNGIVHQEIQREKVVSLDEAIEQVSKVLSEEQGSFREKELQESVANHLVAQAVPAKDIQARIKKEILAGDLVSLGKDHEERVLATQDVLLAESRFIESLQRSKDNDIHEIPNQLVDEVLQEREARKEFSLSAEQTRALHYLVAGVDGGKLVGGLRVVTGDAGSGKTIVLKEARSGWEKAGYQVRGASLSGRAADNLQMESGIPSFTIDKWNFHLRGDAKKPDPQIKLTSRTVLVIDETAMADSEKLYELQLRAEEAKALVCWVGDEKQCQAIGHGGAFVEAERMVHSVRLTENFRQQDEADKLVAKLQSEGKSAEALKNLAERGRFHVDATEQRVMERLANDWAEQGGARNPTSHQVFCGTNEQRRELNRELQDRRLNLVDRVLGKSVENHEGQKLYAGDRVNFRETISFLQLDNTLLDTAKSELKKAVGLKSEPRREQVRNGSFGTVVSVKTDSIRVSMDDGRLLDVPQFKKPKPGRKAFPTPKAFKKKERTEIALGYATTTHAGQGGTFDNVYSLVGGGMQNRELSYVQLSRARHETHLYTSTDIAGDELTLHSKLHDARALGQEGEVKGIEKELSTIHKQKERTVESSRLARGMERSEKKGFALTRLEEEELEREREQHSIGR